MTFLIQDMIGDMKVSELVVYVTVGVVVVKYGINGAKWLYKSFLNLHEKKNEIDEKEETIQSNSKQLADIAVRHIEDYKSLDSKIDALFEVNKIQTRHSLVKSCNEAIKNKRVDSSELQSIEDLYSTYTDILKGNSYVCVLISKVRNLPIENNE